MQVRRRRRGIGRCFCKRWLPPMKNPGRCYVAPVVSCGAAFFVVATDVPAKQCEDAGVAELALVPAPLEAAKLGPQVHKAGRPPKSESLEARWRLSVFIQQERSGIYRPTNRSWGKDAVFFCTPCDREIKFKSHTCKQKLDKHERGSYHQKGLVRLGLAPAALAHVQEPGHGDDSAEDEDVGQAEMGEYRCQGVPVDESTLPLHCLKHSVEAYVVAGQPRTIYAEQETDPLADAVFDSAGNGIHVRSRKCKGPCRRCDKVCAACLALSRCKKFRKALCEKAYMIDLAMYSHRLYHSSPAELQAFVQEVHARDYRTLNLAGSDFESVCSLPSNLAKVAKIRMRLDCLPAWRYSPALQAFKQQWLPKTDLYHSTDLQACAHASLVSSLGAGIATGKVRSLDLEVASKIATGSLRCDALVDGLVTTFVQTLQGSMVNRKRHNSSEWIDQEALVDAMHTLGRGPEAQALLGRFRFNTRQLPKTSFSHASMPETFMSMRDRSVLQKTFQTIQSFLKASAERLHIVLDETTWSAGFQQARNSREGQDKILGGAWDPESGEDWSCLSPDEHPLSTLPKERMARTSLHFVAHRPQCTKFVFECCCLPTRNVIGSSHTMLELLGQFFDVVTEANAGKCPHSVAFDGCTSNSRILHLFVGLLPEEEWKHLAFFKHCEVHAPSFRFWPYGHVLFRGDLVVAFHGSYHLQKRYSLQFMSGSRKVRLGDLFVDLASELSQDLPARAFMCSDVQSDKDAVMRLSPPFLSRSWTGFGQTVHGLIAALLASGTSASPGFSKAEMAENGFCAYFLLVLHVVHNTSKKRESWESLHVTTLRNSCALACGIVTACMTSAEHRLIQERSVEEHFSRIKAPFRGHPSVRDGQQGVLCVHAKQAKQLDKETCESLSVSHTVQDRQPLSEAQLARIAGSALATSIQFFCMICVDLSPDELYAELRKWWRNKSEAFFRAATAPQEEDNDCPEPEVEGAGEQHAQDAAQAANLAIIQAVEDRARIAEHVRDLLSGDGASSMPEDPQVPQDPEYVLPPEPPETEDAMDATSAPPKTLQHVVQKSVRKPDYAKHEVAGPAGMGVRSALKRAQLLVGPSRELMRLVRLEERLLSQAILEARAAPLNQWNLREAELAAARRAANVNGQRLARAAAWAAVTQKWVAGIASKRSDGAAGLCSVEEFRPLKDADPQVLVFWREGVDEKPGLAITLSVFRGAITKQGEKMVVRTSKAAVSPLPAASARKVHVVVLEKTAKSDTGQDLWTASCLSPVLLVEPVNCILGQITAQCQASQTKMHVLPAQASLQDLQNVAEAGARPPRVEIPAGAAPAAEEVEETGRPNTALSFNDRSFVRSTLETEVAKFLRALSDMYDAKGLGFVKDGYVILPGKKKEKWLDVITRVPSYFLERCKQLKGFAFSKQVHLRLVEYLPTKGHGSRIKLDAQYFGVQLHQVPW